MNTDFILTVFPSTTGYSFAVYKGETELAYWGAKRIRGNKSAESLQGVAELLEYFEPHVLIVRDCCRNVSALYQRIQKLVGEIVRLAKQLGIKIVQYSRQAIRACFATLGAKNKHETAEVIIEHHPGLRRYKPGKKKMWENEDHRMGIFDAIALYFTYKHGHEGCGCSPELPTII